jgi:predicted glycosyl hydrolase (DUF1957 family)
MIVIDGNKSELQVKNFDNLEQLLVKAAGQDCLNNRVVTDVLVNEEQFSEIYPHQAEDIETQEIEKVEIKSMDMTEMAVNITRELYKVVQILDNGARQISELFRQADDAEALELLQDLLDVNRNFLGMIASLRDQFSLKQHQVLTECMDEANSLFTEMSEVMENEDWILLADLLEYEYVPAVQRWKKVVAQLREDIREAS